VHLVTATMEAAAAAVTPSGGSSSGGDTKARALMALDVLGAVVGILIVCVSTGPHCVCGCVGVCVQGAAWTEPCSPPVQPSSTWPAFRRWWVPLPFRPLPCPTRATRCRPARSRAFADVGASCILTVSMLPLVRSAATAGGLSVGVPQPALAAWCLQLHDLVRPSRPDAAHTHTHTQSTNTQTDTDRHIHIHTQSTNTQIDTDRQTPMHRHAHSTNTQIDTDRHTYTDTHIVRTHR
jgi:hypothetical protein